MIIDSILLSKSSILVFNIIEGRKLSFGKPNRKVMVDVFQRMVLCGSSKKAGVQL